jgi:hypothetical protein
MRVSSALWRTQCPTCHHDIQPTNRIVIAVDSKARHLQCAPLSEFAEDSRKYFAGVAADIKAFPNERPLR